MNLRNERLDQILTQAGPKSRGTGHCMMEAAGMGTAVAVAQVDELLAGHFDTLKDLPEQAPATANTARGQNAAGPRGGECFLRSGILGDGAIC